jgi:tetratricopeptide (TPR) repeat protein
MRTLLAAALLTALPAALFAAGEETPNPPKKTQTTQDCFSERQWDPDIKKWVKFSQPVNGVWDAKEGKCIRPDRASYMDEDTLYQAVRELAYAGRYDAAETVLAQMPDQTSDKVLTYKGFLNRKLGNLDAAMMFYADALERNPDNLLARSYMGQGYVEDGNLDAARVQLAEIEARGGGYSWAGTSLRKAIYLGKTYNY